MAKKALLTVYGVHRKVKKGFITESAVHHKVKKAFITVGGVYRPCWSEGMGIAYYGQITPMNSYGRNEFGTASNGSYAVFAHGITNSEYTDSVVGYNASLVRSETATYRYSQQLQGGRVGNTAIFQGGIAYDGEANYTTSLNFSVDASLTIKKSDTGHGRWEHKAATAGNRVVFYGGRILDVYYDEDADEWYEEAGFQAYCDAYTESLTHTSEYHSGLIAQMRYPAGASVGNYAVFGGGFDADDWESDRVAAVNSSLQVSYLGLSKKRYDHTATNVGNYALFAGGFNNDDYELDTVDAFNASLTRTSAPPLSTASEGKVSTTIVVDGVEYAVIAGGVTDIDIVNDVDVYDASLTRTTDSNVFNADNRPQGGYDRSNAITPVGNYILYAKNGTQYNGRVDALMVG